MTSRHPCFYRVPPQELHRRNTVTDTTQTKVLNTVISVKRTTPALCYEPDFIWKDTKITALERNIRDLEDEIQTMKSNGLVQTDSHGEEFRQMEVYKNHSKFMKNKEVVKKESELMALQTKLDTLTNQNSDSKKHIEVLKESLTAKEHRSCILQTEVEALRLRVEERESFLNKKNKQIQDLIEEKATLSSEICDLKDMLDVKEKKISILQKKLENLAQQLKERDTQLVSLELRVSSLQADSSNTDSALITLEEALSQKIEEAEMQKNENNELKSKLASLQQRLSEKQACDSDRVSGWSPDLSERLQILQTEASGHQEELQKSHSELQRVTDLLRDLQSERLQQDNRIIQMERQLKEQSQKQSVSPGQAGETSPNTQRQLDDLLSALDKTRKELDVVRQRLSVSQSSLSERDNELSRIRAEHSKQLSEILQLKNMSSPEDVMTLRREKERFINHQKQVHSRMKPMAEHYEDEHIHAQYSHHPQHMQEREPISPPPEQDEEDGIWA
ncbi:ELKS/Rab6-interacting/CAST family member 1 isoform X2 [Danio rerio]|uniref:ELKS/Rab6-interacting/CAST family member 1 isoform X2 n=1 Tax=Danio rerio TaxID=7955 RepID=A0AC58GCH4_DANRE|nr:ERC protein 2 isoform X2 [Danio rerio]|eukprot:XP_021334190.1 ERC protein 2 isoform X2 [Danio rerio]